MMRIIRNTILILAIGFFVGCKEKNGTTEFCKENLDFAAKQTKMLSDLSVSSHKLPRALRENGDMHWAHEHFDWTEGFFPGVCWYLYEYSNNDQWKEHAKDMQDYFAGHRHYTTNHDLGFVFNCSYGNGYRLNGDQESKEILIDAGNSLITRFNPAVGCIQSWDVDKGWQAKRGWEFPVIIDNMMNLELLFELSRITGDNKYQDVAISHADVTLKNHFRNDMSSYHVVDYDSITGEVRARETAQGYAHESAWARGQAWGVYGYTVCYRYTHDPKYLNQAIKIAKFIINHENMPEDHIPYWDYSAPKAEKQPRDASAAAITASALIELSQYASNGDEFLKEARFILENLSSEQYRAKLGQNGNFILKHSVGSIPHNSEIDVPIVYADYYYVEALMRLLKLEKQG